MTEEVNLLEIDSLIEKARTETRPEIRHEIYLLSSG